MGLPAEVTCHLWWPFEAGIRFAVLFLTDQQTPGGHSVKLLWPETWYIPCLCNFTKAGVAAYQNINYSSDSQKMYRQHQLEKIQIRRWTREHHKQTLTNTHICTLNWVYSPHCLLGQNCSTFNFQWGNTFLKGSRVNKHTLQEKLRNLNSYTLKLDSKKKKQQSLLKMLTS